MKALFNRPCYETYLAARGIKRQPADVFYPYPAAMFEKYDTHQLLMLDGGAYLFLNQHMGGASGADVLRGLRSGKLLRPWMRRGKLAWDCAYDDNADMLSRLSVNVGAFYGVHLNSLIPVEKHVWLNRLYFLLPIAHRAFITGAPRWPELWEKYFADWLRAHPYPASVFDEKPARKYLGEWQKTKFIWYDMQVTWRLLVLLHSAFLLSRNSRWSESQWHALYDAIVLHARHVYREGAEELRIRDTGNHFLQKGPALLYAGLLFPELPEAESWIAVGRGIVSHLLKTDIFADGGSMETCPSYSHFIARLFLDAGLALQANRRPGVRGLWDSLNRQYSFLRQTAAPSGKTLQLSDSYALGADLDLEIVRRLAPEIRPAAPRRTKFFKPSCMAVMRQGAMTVYLDGTPLLEGHAHPGKPNLLLYIGGKPALVDSGSPDYDSPERMTWFKTAPAHNAVLVETAGKSKPGARRVVPVIRMLRSKCSAGIAEVTMESRTPDYTAVRSLRLTREGLEIRDAVRARRQVVCRFLLHFAPSKIMTLNPGELIVAGKGWRIRIADLSQTAPCAMELFKRPAFNEANRRFLAPALAASKKGREVCYHYRISLI